MNRDIVLMGIPVRAEDQKKVGVASVTPPPGSIEVTTDCCGIPVWLGVKQQAARREAPDIKIICPGCAAKLYVKGDRIQHLGGVSSKFKMTDGREL